MKSLLTLLFCCCLLMASHALRGQSLPAGALAGTVVDSESGAPLQHATIALKQLPDSTLFRAGLSDANGRFRFDRIPAGSFFMEISYLGYEPLRRPLELKAQAPGLDLGRLEMTIEKKLLQEVTVREDRIPVTIKKDTLEFDAGAFKVPENAVVEELLKKLPGVEVDRDGNIKAMGEQVQEVTVDGNPFFGTDPKIATKNLPANIIDKVQVIDKKSEEAEFSQIEDGNTRKTLNLKLKKDKNNGLFGNLSLGGGSDERFAGKVNLNRFKGNDQLSILGSGNNLNELGFSMQDAMSFMGGPGGLSGLGIGSTGSGGEVNIRVSPGSSGFNSISAGNNGISTPWSGGLNFRDRLSKKLLGSGSYFFNSVGTENESLRQRQNLLSDGRSLNYDEKALTDQNRTNHRVNLQFDYDIDSLSSLQFKPSFSYFDNQTDYSADYQTLSTDGFLLNGGLNGYNAQSTTTALGSELLYRRRFSKAGRSLSASFTGSYNQPESEQINRSFNQFQGRDGSVIADTIQQQQLRDDRNLRGRFRVNYTEPLGRNQRLGFFYEGSRSRQESDQRAFDFNTRTGAFDQLNDQFTNNFENTFSIDEGGLQLQFQRLRSDLTLGVSAQQSSINSVSLGQETTFQRSFFNVFPMALYNYNFSQSKRLRLAYRADTREPSISELQPVPNINNPQYIQLGNPELKPAFIHQINASFNNFDLHSMRSLFARFNASTTVNQIVRSNTINELGQQTSRPVNADGAVDVSGFLATGMPIKVLKLNLSLSTDARYNRYANFLNGAENITRTVQASQTFRLSYDKQEKFNAGMGAGITYNRATYSLQEFLNANFFNFNATADMAWELPLGFRIETDLVYSANTGGSDLYNNRALIWNATLSKYFLANKQGSLDLRAFDLLRQNINIGRTTAENFVEDVQNSIIGQYFLLRFTYRFGSFGGQGMPGPGGGGMRMIRF